MIKNQVYNSFPDDRPITSISVIEDPDKCPPDYYVVSRTHDQDSDADLWKDKFFGRKVTRYLCLSKKTGLADYVVESIAVVTEKDIPPDGYTLLPRTIDSEQKAWRKKQLCYKLSRKNLANATVTDVIVLSKMKKSPEGFTLAGDINGLTICFKVGPKPQIDTNNSNIINLPAIVPPSPLSYSLNPTVPNPTPPPRRTSVNGNSPAEGDEEYVMLRPTRPAPPTPSPTPMSPSFVAVTDNKKNYATMATYQVLDGVPFVLNSSLRCILQPDTYVLPTVRQWTDYQIEAEFGYDFRTERQALMKDE